MLHNLKTNKTKTLQIGIGRVAHIYALYTIIHIAGSFVALFFFYLFFVYRKVYNG